MRGDNVGQTSVVHFYATAPYSCSYLLEAEARSQVAILASPIDTSIYSQLVRLGFRRSGVHIYRPYCDDCNDCISVRVPVQLFQPNRSQRRIYKKHAATLTVRILPLEYRNEHYTLYCRYQAKRHSGGGMSEDNPLHYADFILKSRVDSHLVEFRINDTVCMVSLIDQLDDGLSAVYTFYDPDNTRASYGAFSILWQIEYAKSLGLRYIYLGYWIRQCRKMAYKSQYRPLERLLEERWVEFNDALNETLSRKIAR